MTDFSQMSARALRKVAPGLGITGASRMTKQEILDAIIALDPANRRAGTMTRGERDALHRVSTNVYDPAGHLTPHDARSLAGRNRQGRRWTTGVKYDDAQQRVIIKVRQPADRRDRAGLQQPAQRIDLMHKRAAMRRNAFGMPVAR
jgi:hypothetical protein